LASIFKNLFIGPISRDDKPIILRHPSVDSLDNKTFRFTWYNYWLCDSIL